MGGLHSQGVLEVAAHLLVEAVFQVHEEGQLRFVAFLRGAGDLAGRQARDGRGATSITGHAGRLAQFLQLLGAAIPAQPGVVEVGQLLVVIRGGRAESQVDAILIEKLHDGDGRLVAVFGFGVGIDVRQQLLRVFLFQLDEARVEERETLGPLDLVVVAHAVAGLVGAAHVEVQVDIDAALLELGDLEIQAVELLSIERAAVGACGIDDAARGGEIEKVQADDVDAEAGQGGGPHGGVFLGRQFDRPAAPIGEVDAPEANALAVGFDEVAALDADEAVLAGRRIEEERHVRRGRGRGAMIHHERLEQVVVPLREGAAGETAQESQEPSEHGARERHEFSQTGFRAGVHGDSCAAGAQTISNGVPGASSIGRPTDSKPCLLT